MKPTFLSRIKNALRRSQRPVQQRERRKYVLVRADLSPGLQAAQAVHASDYLVAADPLALYQHPTTIVLAVDNLDELLLNKERHRHIPGAPEGFLFREPDLNGEPTAFACYTDGREYDHLSLALRSTA